jgi:murein L,D-transpeptidase YcbB/YkuD
MSISRIVSVTVVASLLPLLPLSPVSAESLREELQMRFEAAEAYAVPGIQDDDLEALRRFYVERGFAPLWIRDGAVREKARIVVERLLKADEDGLYATDYDAPSIASLIEDDSHAGRADLEFKLSRAYLRYGADISAGRVDPARVDEELYIHPKAVPQAELLGAVDGADFAGHLDGLAPQSDNYKRLKSALADYRRLEEAGGWGTVPEGETLKPGMTGPAIVALRKRLAASGDLAADAVSSPHYDDVLEAAVRRFQYRHGLTVDGAVGKNSRTALNVPVAARIEQMLLNMERRRWMPDDLGHTYVFVNMADFVLKVVAGPKTILDTRVVIGKPYHRTPVFSDKMRYIVVNPYWTVPPSIARKEILPKLRKNANYLNEKNMKLFSGWNASAKVLDPLSIDWQATKPRGFTYKIRQEPGEGNALGDIKFMFPNRFNVYLHDTQSRNLFSRTVRSFSHGCIRVQYPDKLAAMLLRDQEDWSLAKISEVIESRQRTVINLKMPIPVHLTYLTAWVNKDGSVHFRRDIYGRDERLMKVINWLQRPI